MSYDSRQGCLFLNNRYHDPTLGTFISVDPLVAATGEPYIYASGNPTTLSDPTGLCSMVAGDFYCGNINFGSVAMGDYDSNLHSSQFKYEFENGMLDTVDIDRPECGNGCSFGTGLILGMVSTLGAPLLAYSSAMNDPVGTVTDAVDPRTYVEAAKGCVSSAEGAGSCVGSALMAGAVGRALCGGSACRPGPADRLPECSANSFVPGTLVLMADGSRMPIEEIEVGNSVWAADPVTGEAGPRRVVDVIVGDGSKQLVDVRADGATLTATAQHPFWVDDAGRWVDADDLEPGDELVDAAGDVVEVDAVREWSAVRRVHNLTVEGVHTYFVVAGDDPVLVHNCIRNQHLAGARHPVTGVPFDADGFPTFSSWRHPNVDDVRIQLSGNRATDFARSNRAAGLTRTPTGYTWHHHQTPGLMQLVETAVHQATGHSGGFSQAGVRYS